MARGDYDGGVVEGLGSSGGGKGGLADKKEAELSKPDPRPARLDIAKVEVLSGPRKQNEVDRAVRAARAQFIRCLGESDLKPGATVIELSIDKDGKVIASKVVSGATGQAGRCLVRPTQMLRLPALPEGQTGITVVRVTLSVIT